MKERGRKQSILTALLSIWLTSACSSDSASTPRTTIEPKLSAIEQNIFQRSCTFSSCHGADTPKEGLSLVGPTHHLLVNQPSSEVPTRMLVLPADPGGSYLLEKISSATPTSGSRMPYASSPLPDSEITAVRQWIELGAQDD